MLIRVTKSTYEKMKNDLRRPHRHAGERVGYAFIKPNSSKTLEVIDYISIPDEFYVQDFSVGAHVDHRAIVLAMKRADHNNEGVLQVHEHGGRGVPSFSKVDIDSHPVYLRSFRNANPSAIHGFLLLSKDSMIAKIWMPKDGRPKEILSYKITAETVYDWLSELLQKIRKVWS